MKAETMTAQDILAHAEAEGFKLRNINGSVRFLPRPDKQPSEDLRRLVRQFEPELVLMFPVSDPAEPTPLRPETAQEPRRRTLLGQRIVEGVEPPKPLLAGILYRATVNSWHGEAGDGKTTIALWASWALIQQGHTILWLDEEAGPDQIAEKLQEMGANPEELDARFHYYYSPAFSMDTVDLAELRAIVTEAKPVMIVWDSAPDAFAASKIHEDSADEITEWMRSVATPLARDFDLALVLLDHVTKAAEGRNGYARGSGAKKAKMDASFTVIKTCDFDRNRLGTIEMKRAKNRLGVLSPLVRFTVGGRDGELVCERHETAAEQREELSDRDRVLLKMLHERFYREGAQTRELAEATGWKDPMVHRSRRALLAHECIAATGEGKNQRYAITAKGRATLGLAPAYTPPLTQPDAFSRPCQNGSDRVADSAEERTAILSDDTDSDSPATQGENATLSPCHDPVIDPVATGSNPPCHPVTPFNKGDRVTGSDELLMWEWVCDIHAGRADDVPEGVRRAAQQAGFQFDSFAPVGDEATRLGAFLDAREAGR